MKAWLSALSGRALLQHTPEQFSLCELGREALLPLTQAQAWQHWRMRQDWEEHQVADAAELRARLTEKTRQQRALDMALMSLDATLSDGLRREALAALDAELTHPELARWLDDLFSLRPLPDGTDITAALALADATPRAQHWLTLRQQGQAGASQLWNNWGQLHTVLTEEAQDALRLRLLGSGLLTELAEQLRQGKGAYAMFTLPTALQKLGVTNGRSVAQTLCRQNTPRQTLTALPSAGDEDDTAAETASKGKARHKKIASKPQTTKPRAINRPAVLANVQKQKAFILEQLRLRRPDKAEQLVAELAKYQLAQGHASHLAKSLSDLATQASEHGYLQQALQWSELALRHASDDVIAKNVRAEALRSLNRLDEALAAYQAVIDQHPENVVAKTGRAETLRSLNRLDDALAAYQAVIDQHPQDVFAKTGLAETLRSLNRLDDALAAYQAVIDQHPQNVFAKTGLAETLRSLNRLDDALAAYQAVIDQHPQDVVAKNARAETLRSLNRLDEALAAYQAVIDQHPENVVAKTARAETLHSLNRLDEALAAYQAVIDQHPENVVAKTARAETLRSLNRLDDALAAYQAVIDQRPENVVAKNGLAETLRSLNRLDDALAAYQAVIDQHPQDVVAKNGLAETLRSQGRLENALEVYQATARDFPHDAYAQAGVATLHVLLGRPEQAVALLPDSPPQRLSAWVAWHIRGMALLRLRQWSEAEQVFVHGAREAPPAQRQAFVHGARLLSLWRPSCSSAPSLPVDAGLSALSAADWRERLNTLPGRGEWVVQMHALALQHAAVPARQLQQHGEQAALPPVFQTTAQELVLRAEGRGQQDDDWLLTQEIDCLLQAA